MQPITRRHFAGLTLAAGTGTLPVLQSASLNPSTLNTSLGASVKRHNIPAASAMVAGPDRILYHGAFGQRDSGSRVPVTSQSIFRIASMTKPVTAVAAMQLVEREKIKLEDPVAKYLPELENLQSSTASTPMESPASVRPQVRYCCVTS